jgi:hypothetical protein
MEDIARRVRRVRAVTRGTRTRHLREIREDASFDTPRRLLLAGNVPHTRAPPGARARSRMTTG